jgi:hypothetical protein
MLRYKLVKLYPNSPPLGTEVNYSETHKIYNNNGGNYYIELPKHQVENLPEFWQEIKEVKLEVPIGTKFKHLDSSLIYTIDSLIDDEVKITWSYDSTKYPIGSVNTYFKEGTWIIYKEKSFEILEFKYSDRIDTLRKNGKYAIVSSRTTILEEGVYYIESYLIAIRRGDDWKINKVKRLSDGVILKISDPVTLKNANGDWSNCFIKGFELKEDCIRVIIKDTNWDALYNLENVLLRKTPLFIDEIGNELFEGDKVFSVCHKYDWQIEDDRTVTKASKFVQDKYKEQAAWKFFKYKEDRDKYVLENKPTYSKKQILDALKDNTSFSTSFGTFTFVAENRVKEKLGL